MIEGNNNWVCFDCKKIVRIPKSLNENWQEVICSECGKNCVNLGSKQRLPKKSNEKAWKKLQKFNAVVKIFKDVDMRISSIDHQRCLRGKIENLEERSPESKDRRKLIDELKKLLH